MIIDANLLPEGSAIRGDVCVIGSGAAGITIARILARHGLDVVLLEGGGLDPEVAAQRLYDAQSVGVRYSPTRLRYFGGSSNCWGGLCHPLDEDDFEPREWIPHSGWPIRRSDLDPFYREARSVLDIAGQAVFEDVERDTSAYPRLLRSADAGFEPILWLKSPPTRLGKKFRDEITQADRIRCYLHANVIELIPNDKADAILHVKARALEGRALSFSAPRYVLSTGGIENARLLLSSDTTVPGGLGNGHDLVGRFFMEHTFGPVGRMVVATPPGKQGFQEEAMRDRGGHDLPGAANGLFGYRATRRLRTRHRLLGLSINAFKAATPDAVETAVGDLVTAPHDGASGDAPPPRTYPLIVFGELAPNPNSRVRLDTARDALGQRRAIVDLEESPNDRRTLRKGIHAFALDVARSGHGRVMIDLPEDSAPFPMAGGHHIGTTRMADDPLRGVTDRNGLVHGIANLFVAGSSLFPTSAFANPTYTIVALAIRQAEHIAATTAAARELRPPQVDHP